MRIFGQIIISSSVQHGVPANRVPVTDSIHGHNIPFLVAVIPFLTVLFFNVFTGIEITLIFAVNKKIGHNSAAGYLTHIHIQTPEEFVFNEWISSVVVAPTQNDALKTFNFEGKQWIFKSVLAILAAEVEPETKFAISRP